MQEEIIQSVLDGRDTLALLPTGGGKSICYQVPALCREGICLVVSPLIALMKDQVFHLQRRGIAAEAIFSGLHFKDIDRILDNCIYGDVKLLYCRRNGCGTELARERIKKMKVNLLAVDEAHCISQWGYDFRPSYLQIQEIREWLPDTPVLAVTATATPEVVRDIQEKAGLCRGTGFAKKLCPDNLSYVVLPRRQQLEKTARHPAKGEGQRDRYVRTPAQVQGGCLLLAGQEHRGCGIPCRTDDGPAQCPAGRMAEWPDQDHGSDQCFWDGDRQGRCASGHPPGPAGKPGGVFPGGGPGWARWEKGPMPCSCIRKPTKAFCTAILTGLFRPWKTCAKPTRRSDNYCQLAVGGGAGATFDFDLAEFSRTYHLEPLRVYSCLKILEQEEWLILTEAVFIPSTLKVEVDKEELYDFLIRHKQYDRILKTILRTYQGAFRNL